MYRTSSDRRFYKIKKDIRGAFMTLVLQKDHYSDISITEVAELADINRKTFYLHYDSIDDILTEYADDLSADFMNYLYSQEEFSVESLFDWIGRHAEEKEFFRKMAAEDRIMPFTDKCRRVLRDYLQAHMIAEKGQTARSQKLVASYTAAGLAQILVEYASGETDLDRERGHWPVKRLSPAYRIAIMKMTPVWNTSTPCRIIFPWSGIRSLPAMPGRWSRSRTAGSGS